MARQRLASLINPAACNDPQTAQLARSVFTALQIIDEILNIQINEDNEYEYNLENLTSVDVEEIYATQTDSEYIDVWNELTTNNITAIDMEVTNIDVTNNATMVDVTMTYVEILELDVSIVTAYEVTYTNLYNETTYVCPSACGSPAPSPGDGCDNCVDVDALPGTIYMDVTWGGATSTITLTRTSQVLSSDGDGYCESKYAGSGAFGGGDTAQFKVWARYSCAPGAALDVKYVHDRCTGTFDEPDDNIALWRDTDAGTKSANPLYGHNEEPAAPISDCGEDFGPVEVEIYE